jgi:hypothetical protein
MKGLLMKAMPEFTRGLAQRLMTYALGRGIEPYDRLAVKNVVDRTAAQEYRFAALVQAIVASPPFQQRRGEIVLRNASAGAGERLPQTVRLP